MRYFTDASDAGQTEAAGMLENNIDTVPWSAAFLLSFVGKSCHLVDYG